MRRIARDRLSGIAARALVAAVASIGTIVSE
jgi:hypothetical protein